MGSNSNGVLSWKQYTFKMPLIGKVYYMWKEVSGKQEVLLGCQYFIVLLAAKATSAHQDLYTYWAT